MFPGMNDPKQMQRMLKQLGLQTEETDAEKITIESEGKKIYFKDAKLIKMSMQGQNMYQIIGEPIFEDSKEFDEEDIEMVASQSNVSKEKAKDALDKCEGDIAKAILMLKS